MSNENSTTNIPLQSREWEVIFYEDNENHVAELQELLKDKRVVGAYHNRDETDEGVVKKAHYHVLIKFENGRLIGSVLKLIPNHEENLIRSVKSFKGACRYLLHLDNPEKHQYTLSNLVGNVSIAQRYLQTEDFESEGVRKIVTFIDECDTIIFDKDVLYWCCQEGLYSIYRRGAYIFSRVIEQHNKDVHNRWGKNLEGDEWKYIPYKKG